MVHVQVVSVCLKYNNYTVFVTGLSLPQLRHCNKIYIPRISFVCATIAVEAPEFATKTKQLMNYGAVIDRNK